MLFCLLKINITLTYTRNLFFYKSGNIVCSCCLHYKATEVAGLPISDFDTSERTGKFKGGKWKMETKIQVKN